MSFTLSQLFPGIEAGLNRIGFLFGAGTSKEAGYPMIKDLTKTVVANLPALHKMTFDEILAAKALTYDPASGTPDIEFLSDLVTEYYITTQESRYGNLESEIRKLIVETILAVSTPDITHHVRFFESLKRRAHGTSTTVTIITTNYDVLFELAAAEAGIRIETGFDGSIRRVFNPIVFDLKRGIIENKRFIAQNELQVNVIKLHGSISWLRERGQVIESGIGIQSAISERALVLPRRRKVMDTLSEPFDQLFTRASRMLGSNCQYVVACGFSFGDKHINDQLIYPKLNAGKIRLTALCGEEPDCLSEFKKYQAFHAGFPTSCFIDHKDTEAGTNLWKFSVLAQLLEP